VSIVVDNIGLLVTNDESLGEGPLGLLRNAAVVIEDGEVVAVEKAGALADEQVDAAGRCVIPGFVDSHTHLVFAGDRGDEFAARMAGAPYAAGGIRVTTDATRAAPAEELLRLAEARREEARRAGITHLEIKSGYGLDVETERRCCGAAARSPRSSPRTSRSSAPTSSPPAPTPTSTSRSSPARCSKRAHRSPAGSTSSARRARSTPTSRARCSRPAVPPGSACACTATSSAPALACGSPSSSAPPPSTTAPT
jgi:hypothetical protein